MKEMNSADQHQQHSALKKSKNLLIRHVVLYLWYTRILVATMTGVWCGAGQVLPVLCHVSKKRSVPSKNDKKQFLVHLNHS
jgi:hypothetical protein